jgi:hypothetical protein
MLEALTQGRKEHRHQAGGDEGDEQVAHGLEQCAKRTDDQHIDSDDTGSEDPIDQGAVDDDVNVPKPGTEDGKSKGNWEEQEEQIVDSGEEDISKWTLAYRREKNCKNQTAYDVPPNGYRHSENDPLGLLALYAVRYTKIAVDLGYDRPPHEHEKSYRHKYEVIVGIDLRPQKRIAPIESQRVQRGTNRPVGNR